MPAHHTRAKTALVSIEDVSEVPSRVRAADGICLGMQILVKTAGGDVIPSVPKEIGFWNQYFSLLDIMYIIGVSW